MTLLVGSVIFARAPGHRVGTILFASGVLTMLSADQTPLENHSAAAWLGLAAIALNTFSVPLIMVSLLRFPSGRLVGPGWRWAEVFAGVVLVVGAVAAFINNAWGGDIEQAISDDGPLRDDLGSLADTLSGAFFPGLLAVCVVGLTSVTINYRRGTARERTQIRWLLFAVVVMVIMIAALNTFVSATSSSTHWSAAAVGGSIALVPTAIGIAIVRHQLFDIDVVISRTLVYASTLALIAGIYVAVVFGAGSLIDQTGDGSPVLPVIATALVAIVFHPARVRLERRANRIVFGRRATPYEVLSDFTQRLAATDEQLLADVARSVADGTVVTGASVWLVDGGMLEPVSIWPDERGLASTTPLPGPGGEVLVPGADETYPIRHDDDLIGALGLQLPATESLPPGDRALIEELTAGISLALWNRELTSELRGAVHELLASRRRLVSIQDETRHRLERDLHDGAQQRLVAIKVRLSIVRQMMDKAGEHNRATALAELCDDADEAIESLRDVARGIYPPLLEAEGLRTALEAQIGRSSLSVELSGELHARHGRDIEATTYFTILEALAAIERLGPMAVVQIRVTEEADRLVFEILGPSDTEPPLHVEDRIEALGGQVGFGDGNTVVRGWLPTTPIRQTVTV
ncbi:MAG: sensor histidine kinase [Acidimicrobiales bacterium]